MFLLQHSREGKGMKIHILYGSRRSIKCIGANNMQFCSSSQNAVFGDGEEDEKFAEKVSKILKKPLWNSLLKALGIAHDLNPDRIDRVLLKNEAHEDAKSALKFFAWSEKQLGSAHNINSCCILLPILARANMFRTVNDLVKRLIRGGPMPSDKKSSCSYANKLVDVLIEKCRRDCRSSIVVFESLLEAYLQAGMALEATVAFQRIQSSGFVVGIRSCNGLLKALLKNKWKNTSWRVYLSMLRSGNAFDVYSYSMMINLCCSEGKLQQANDLLTEMEKRGCFPNVVCYNTLIHGHCRKGNLREAFELKDTMSRKGLVSDIFTYSAFIHGLCKKGKTNEAKEILREIFEVGLMPNEVIYTTLIDGYVKEGDIGEAFRLRDEMLGRGLVPDVYTFNSLIHGLCKVGKMLEANELLQEMVRRAMGPYSVAYTSVIDGYCKAGNVVESFKLFNEMSKRGIEINAATYNALIHGLCRAGEIQQANMLLKEMLKRGLMPNSVTCAKLMDKFCKEGFMDEAFTLKDEMMRKGILPDALTYNSLILTLYENGKIQGANQLLKEMADEGLLWKDSTYCALIHGYCKPREMEKSREVSFVDI